MHPLFSPPHTTSLVATSALFLHRGHSHSCSLSSEPLALPMALVQEQHSFSSVLSQLLVFSELLRSCCLQEEGTEEPREYRAIKEAGQAHLGSLCPHLHRAFSLPRSLPPSLPLEMISVLLTCCQLLQQEESNGLVKDFDE